MSKKLTYYYRSLGLGILLLLLFLSCGNPNQTTYISTPPKSDKDPERVIEGPKVQPVPKTYTVNFEVPGNDSCRVIITVRNPGMKVVRHLIDSTYVPGKYSYEWDRRGDDKEILKTGLYYYQFEVCGKISTLRLTHMPVIK